MKTLALFLFLGMSAQGQTHTLTCTRNMDTGEITPKECAEPYHKPSTPPAGHIQCWEAKRKDHSRHVMCGDSWGLMVDVTEALEKKHQEFCKSLPGTNGVQICNGAGWHP